MKRQKRKEKITKPKAQAKVSGTSANAMAKAQEYFLLLPFDFLLILERSSVVVAPG
ncbi:MAG: hypothetical protein AB1757_05285 [Acidobacteriota bacterium]